MRIGIEGTPSLLDFQTGIERYTTMLIRELIRLSQSTPAFELFLYFHVGHPEANASLLRDRLPDVNSVRYRTYPLRRFWYRPVLPLLAWLDDLQLFHFTSPMMPPFFPCRTVLTVHDLCWAKLPKDIVFGERLVDMPLANKAIQKADGFIAVSDSTKKDLITENGVDPFKIATAHEGVDKRFRPSYSAAMKARAKYGLDNYLLYVGTLQKRKNLNRLLRAFSIAVERFNIPHTLVLAGRQGWGYEEVYQEAMLLLPKNRVRFLGYVPDIDLPGLYAGASVFIYPSLYEGFGLPVLEAMASGTPVAVARDSSLPEIAGEAAAYFNPHVPEEIANTIGILVSDKELSSRLSRLGLTRASEFSWAKAASRTVRAYSDFCQASVALS